MNTQPILKICQYERLCDLRKTEIATLVVIRNLHARVTKNIGRVKNNFWS